VADSSQIDGWHHGFRNNTKNTLQLAAGNFAHGKSPVAKVPMLAGCARGQECRRLDVAFLLIMMLH
jgi:hypothetical protein